MLLTHLHTYSLEHGDIFRLKCSRLHAVVNILTHQLVTGNERLGAEILKFRIHPKRLVEARSLLQGVSRTTSGSYELFKMIPGDLRGVSMGSLRVSRGLKEF